MAMQIRGCDGAPPTFAHKGRNGEPMPSYSGGALRRCARNVGERILERNENPPPIRRSAPAAAMRAAVLGLAQPGAAARRLVA